MIHTDGIPTISNAPALSGFRVRGGDSLWLVEPLDANAKLWLTENVADDAQYFGCALVVEHRYVADLLDGIFDAGFKVR